MQTTTDNSSFVPDAWIGIDVAKNTFDAALQPVAHGKPARDIPDIPVFTYNRTEKMPETKPVIEDPRTAYNFA